MALYRIAKAIEVPKNMLVLSGVWPRTNPSLWYQLRKFLSYSATIILQLLMFFEVLISIQDIFNLSDILLLSFEYFAYAFRLVVFYLEKLKVRSLSDRLNDPLFNSYKEHHNVFVKSAIARTTLFGNAFKVSCVLTTSFLALKPFIGGTIYPIPFSFFHDGFMWYVVYVLQVGGLAIGTVENFNAFLNTVYHFVNDLSTFNLTTTLKNIECVVIIESKYSPLQGSRCIWNNAAMDTLCLGYMGIALAELDILIYNIKNFAGEVTNLDSTVDEYLYTCCKLHNKIIEFIQNIERVWTKGILVQYVSSIFVICSAGFHLIMTPLFSGQFVVLVIYFCAVMIELAMYCWVGNEIILKSFEVGDACYTSEWYRFTPRTNRILFLVMERAKRPITISAYKFSVLSLSAYLKIIQSSYSHFTVLRRMYMKE